MNSRSALTFSPGAAGPFLKEASQRERPPFWTESAVCAEVDPELFFPEEGESTWAARQLCAGCEVKAECLAFALENGEHGIWGGLEEYERHKLARDPSPEAICVALDRVGKKVCTRCRELKDVSDFPFNTSGNPIHNCRPCWNVRGREIKRRRRAAVADTLEAAA